MFDVINGQKRCDHCGTWVSYYHPVCAQCGRNHHPDWVYTPPPPPTEEELEEQARKLYELKQKVEQENAEEQVKNFWAALVFFIFIILVIKFFGFI